MASVAAPAKVNLNLRIEGRRADGYHLLDSVVVPIGICDRVVVRVNEGAARSVSVRTWPPGTAPDDASNLCVRAAALYLHRTAMGGHAHIDLRKEVPAGAGMGGGSSDAAATLRLLNALAGDPVPPIELARWALELGADVPFFLTGRPARMRGIGEILDPITLPLSATRSLVVAFPGIPLETRHVYAKYDDSLTTEAPVSRIRGLTVDHGPLHEWLGNDLELAACQILPVLNDLKLQLRALGALGVAMTGSGSAVFGIWSCAEEATDAAQTLGAAGVWARATSILDTLPAVTIRDADDDGRSPSW